MSHDTVAFDIEHLELAYNRKYSDILAVLTTLESDRTTHYLEQWKHVRKLVKSAANIDKQRICDRVTPRNESIGIIIYLLQQVVRLMDEYSDSTAQCRMCGNNLKFLIGSYERLSDKYIRLYQTVEPNIVR
jgi:hypothetical protein